MSATPIAERGLVGDLYVPHGRPGRSGPRPGVLLLGGSEGGRPDPAFATLLASRGVVVLALAYFGLPGLPPRLAGVPVEYGLAGAELLASRPEVGGRPIAVHGTSKGAEYALLLAATAPRRFAAVVAVAPSDVVWPALAFVPGPARSSWTLGGLDVPFVPPAPTRTVPPAGPGIRLAATYAGSYDAASAVQREAARIRVERIAAPVLLVSAGDDGIWPSAPQARRVSTSLTAAGSRLLEHPDAGHFVGDPPNLPTTSSLLASGPITIDAGGRPAATARARVLTDAAVRDLFARALGA